MQTCNCSKLTVTMVSNAFECSAKRGLILWSCVHIARKYTCCYQIGNSLQRRPNAPLPCYVPEGAGLGTLGTRFCLRIREGGNWAKPSAAPHGAKECQEVCFEAQGRTKKSLGQQDIPCGLLNFFEQIYIQYIYTLYTCNLFNCFSLFVYIYITSLQFEIVRVVFGPRCLETPFQFPPESRTSPGICATCKRTLDSGSPVALIKFWRKHWKHRNTHQQPHCGWNSVFACGFPPTF